MVHKGNRHRFWDAWNILLVGLIVTAFAFPVQVKVLHLFLMLLIFLMEAIAWKKIERGGKVSFNGCVGSEQRAEALNQRWESVRACTLQKEQEH